MCTLYSVQYVHCTASVRVSDLNMEFTYTAAWIRLSNYTKKTSERYDFLLKELKKKGNNKNQVEKETARGKNTYEK